MVGICGVDGLGWETIVWMGVSKLIFEVAAKYNYAA